jgi:hypothetical protein
MALTPEEIAGIATATLAELGEHKITDISLEHQSYEAWSLVNKNKMSLDSGKSITWNVRTGKNDNATEAVGLYDVEQPTPTDNLTTASIPWKYLKTSFAYDVREEKLNMGKRQIIDLIKERHDEAWLDLYDYIERVIWGAAPAESDNLTMYGVLSWIVTNATPSGWTAAPGGLDNARFKNYTDTYAAYDYDDMVKSIRRAADFTNFKNPHKGNMANYATKAEKGIYTTYNVLENLRDVVRDQNDSIGFDLVSSTDNPTFRGRPINWLPITEESGFTAVTDPVYLIDWSVMGMTCHRNWNGVKTGPVRLGQQIHVNTVRWDWQANVICRDRRRQAVLYKV